MPLYPFVRVDKPSQSQDLLYHMNDAPSIGAVITDETGVQWRRVASKPQAAIDTKVDPYSVKDYIKATNKKGVIGDLYDRSAEASARRAEKEGGIDPVKEKWYEDYSKRRHGKKHPQQAREQTQRALKKSGITIDYGD